MGHGSGTPIPLPPGARVTLRGAAWRVARHTPYEDCVALRLDATQGPASRTFLLPFDRPSWFQDRQLAIVSPRAWLHGLRASIANTYPFGGLRTPPPGIDLLPYQLEPAVAMLRHGYARLLVAHDVGMGKTIEAAMVLCELAARREGFRALVLAPAGLRQQWHSELRDKFDVSATIADAAWLRDAARVLPPGVNPWSPPGTYIASFDFVKRPEALRGLELERWDLVVVDEAHACSASTDRRLAVDAAARRARRLLLLTATPPPSAAELDALCRIGAGRGAPAPVLRCQRQHSPLGDRRSVLLPVRPSDLERRMHRLLARYATLLWRGGAGAAPTRLLGTVLRKRALSSAASLERSLRRRQELLAGQRAGTSQLQLLLPLHGLEEDPRDDCVSDGLLAADGLMNRDREQRWLTRLAEAAHAATRAEGKIGTLLKLLRRVREPVIVFTEYRDTLERLHAVLQDGRVPCCVLHGGLAPEQRRAALSMFAGGGHVLLATDTAAEGLNLHQRCRTVLHYELPWNPARLLQRAGRVDRFGQRRRVHELALVARDTAESLVLAPLARRARRSDGLGPGGRMVELLTESRVAAMVFEGASPTLPSPSAPAPDPFDCSRDARDETRRLQERRRTMPADEGRARPSSVLVTMLRLQSLAPGLVLLFEVTFTGPHGEIEERDLAVIHVQARFSGWRRSPGEFHRRLTETLPPLTRAVAPTLQAVLDQRLQRLQPAYAAAQRRLLERAEELRAIDALAARQIVQRGLFERPAPPSTQRPCVSGVEAEEQHDCEGGGATATLSASSELIAVLVAVRC